MKKILSVVLVFTTLALGWACGASADTDDSRIAWFQAVVNGNNMYVQVKPIYWDDALVVSMPTDWNQVDSGDGLLTFAGTDENENAASVALQVVDSNGMSLDDFERGAKGSRVSCQITVSDFAFYVALEEEHMYSASLFEDAGLVYMIRASLNTPNAMYSDKLIGDLHQILCNLRRPYDGELEEHNARIALEERGFSEEEVVVFSDAEFERMVHEALEKAEGEAVYAPELELVTRLTMRFGIAEFSEKVIQSAAKYNTPERPLDLSDLRLFPNLEYVSVTDMACTGFEALADLPKLRRLTLIGVGVTDCDAFAQLPLTRLNLARNDIESFAPLASMTALKALNLYMTGLDSLEVLRNLNHLEMLLIGGNPITDLEPLEEMKNLTYLSLRGTEVKSLDVLRKMDRLETLDVSEMGSISLEPLYGNESLRQIMAMGTQLSEADKKEFEDIL